jgi:ribosomal protein S18 acetylase RimI-like enzyme
MRQGIAMKIRRVTPDEWRELRDTRLAALRDTPDAFGTTYEGALSRTDEWWQDWAQRSAESGGQAMFLAWDDGQPVGIAGAFRDDGGIWNIVAMWVDPRHRREGIGRALLDAVTAHVRAQGATKVVLGVTEGNDAARALYERYGFAATEKTFPLRAGSPLLVHELALEL